MSWKEVIQDPDEAKVFVALDGPGMTWRTASAIARQTGLPETSVNEITRKYTPTLIRLSAIPSITGSTLIGLLERVG